MKKYNLSYSSINRCLNINFCFSREARHKTKLKMKKLLKTGHIDKRVILSKDELEKIGRLFEKDEQQRKRKICFYHNNTARFGEIVEVDGCFDYWIDDNKFCIYAAVDKATGKMLSTYAEEQETTAGYAKLLTKLFQNYGVPEIIRSDNRISFYSAGRNGTPLDYCLEKLGCKVTSSSIATYKPNVERSFKTLQNNLAAFTFCILILKQKKQNLIIFYTRN